MIKNIKNYLSELGFNKSEASIYLVLTRLGEAKASQIAKIAGLPRTTVISILDKLIENNHITSNVYRGTTSYWIESPQVLLDNLNLKIEIAEKLKEALPDIYRIDGRFPSAKSFDTKKSIKNFIEKTLNSLEKGATIYTIDTPQEGNYSKIFSDDMWQTILGIKKRRGIVTKTLVPAGASLKISKSKLSSQNIIIKELPSSLEFRGSLWLIKDMLINFSGNPPFLVVIKQGAIVGGINSLYRFLWDISAAKACFLP